MIEGPIQKQPFDEYADQFTITLTPFGANLSFGVREPHPAQARNVQSSNLGTIRMSVEHLKVMTMVIQRQVLKVQEESGLSVEVPQDILNQLQIPLEDWQAFWKSSDPFP